MYFEPEFKVVMVEAADVIRTSTTNPGGGGSQVPALPEDTWE